MNDMQYGELVRGPFEGMGLVDPGPHSNAPGTCWVYRRGRLAPDAYLSAQLRRPTFWEFACFRHPRTGRLMIGRWGGNARMNTPKQLGGSVYWLFLVLAVLDVVLIMNWKFAKEHTSVFWAFGFMHAIAVFTVLATRKGWRL